MMPSEQYVSENKFPESFVDDPSLDDDYGPNNEDDDE